MLTWLKSQLSSEGVRWVVATWLAAISFGFGQIVPWLDQPAKPSARRWAALLFILLSAAVASWAILARGERWRLLRRVAPGEMICNNDGWEVWEDGVVPVFDSPGRDKVYRNAGWCHDLELSLNRCRIELEVLLNENTTIEFELLSRHNEHHKGYHFYLRESGLSAAWPGTEKEHAFQYNADGRILPAGQRQTVSIAKCGEELSVRVGEETGFTFLDRAHLTPSGLGNRLMFVATSTCKERRPWIGALRVYG